MSSLNTDLNFIICYVKRNSIESNHIQKNFFICINIIRMQYDEDEFNKPKVLLFHNEIIYNLFAQLINISPESIIY